MSNDQTHPAGEDRTEPTPGRPARLDGQAGEPGPAPSVPPAPSGTSAPSGTAAPPGTAALSEPQPAWPPPVSPQPASAQPASAQPVTVPPASAQPASAQPASAQPASAQPTSAQPVTSPLPPVPPFGAPGSAAPVDPSRAPSPPPAAPGYPSGPYSPPTAPPFGAGTYPWPAAQPRAPFLSETMRKRLLAGGAALAIALTGGAIGGVIGYGLHDAPSALQLPATTGNGSAAPVIDRSSLASIAAALQPAIVDIMTNAGEGSGVVISADGNIVTNNHVLAGARNDSIRVTFNSGRQVPATVVGTDPQTDIAVIKVDAEGLAFASWGDSDSVQVGDTVLAIGSPLGLQGSVTAGIVSALNRTITVREGPRSMFDTGNTTVIGGAIQTDAPINSGNSGGALVNMRGEVIGINTAIATAGMNGNIGVGFAISSNRAKAVADALIAGEEVHHPFIGVRISDHESGGAYVAEVLAGSPADQGGLRSGDVVTKVGEQPIRGTEDLIGAIQGSEVGEQLTLTVRRDGSEQTITVTVGEQ